MVHLYQYLFLALGLFSASFCGFAQGYDRALVRTDPGESAAGPEPLALVIGNSAYNNAPLSNPVNDAEDMAAALESLGFQVIKRTNADEKTMKRALKDFGKRLRKNRGVGLFYFAGHGMQIQGRNYLIPVGSDIEDEDEVEFSSLDANLVLAKMESADNPLNIVILDACRNNPFSRGYRSASAGLAQMDAPTGSLVAFATAPGQTAADGTQRNGTYTKHLLENMRKPGLQVEDVFKQVRIGVLKDTDGGQTPWENTSLKGDFYFVPKPENIAAESRQSTQVAALHTIQSGCDPEIEEALWAEVKEIDHPDGYREFLSACPSSKYSPIARVRSKRFGEFPSDSDDDVAGFTSNEQQAVPMDDTQVREYLTRARTAYRDDKLMTPSHDSAVKWARDALNLAPDNREARAILTDVIGRYLKLAYGKLKRGDYRTARVYVDRAKSLDDYASVRQIEEIAQIENRIGGSSATTVAREAEQNNLQPRSTGVTAEGIKKGAEAAGAVGDAFSRLRNGLFGQ